MDHFRNVLGGILGRRRFYRFIFANSVVREQPQDNLSKIWGIVHDISKYVGLDQTDQADKTVLPSERIYLVPFNRTKVVTMESINALKDQLLECRS